MENLVGQQFGKLTVLYDSGKRSNKHHIYWHCKCECGKEIDIKSTRLINHLIHSCGCDEKEYEYQNPIENLSNQKFGKLTPIKYIGNNQWKCLCDCGNFCIKKAYYLKNGRTLSCGCTLLYAGEQKINNILIKNNILFEREKIFNTCFNPKTNCPFRFDFYVNNKYIIEFDGKQHFEASGYGWNTQENLIKTKEHDKIKNQWCKDNNISLIRIPYTHYNELCLEDLLSLSKFKIN